VRLIGGEIVTNFEPVTGPQVLDRLDPAVHGKVVQANLATLGITDFGSVNEGGLELFFNEQPMPISRWPNKGFARSPIWLTVTRSMSAAPRATGSESFTAMEIAPNGGNRQKRHGYWFWDWSDQRHSVEPIDVDNRIISVRSPYHGYGYRQGQCFYAFNLLSEMDQPSKWYLDRQSDILYFHPPSESGTTIVPVTLNAVSLEDVKQVSFENLTVKAFRADAIRLQNCSHNRIVGYTIRSVGSWALQVIRWN
jgi:hypothetical protein